jgi:hypothetical protein
MTGSPRECAVAKPDLEIAGAIVNSITCLVGSIFFPKLVMDHRVRELRKRMRLISVVSAALLVMGVVALTLHVSKHPFRPVISLKPTGR